VPRSVSEFVQCFVGMTQAVVAYRFMETSERDSQSCLLPTELSVRSIMYVCHSNWLGSACQRVARSGRARGLEIVGQAWASVVMKTPAEFSTAVVVS
jgi:hypothetical protein